MDRIPAAPSTNGYNGAPPAIGGASAIPKVPVQIRTVFPAELAPDSARSFLLLLCHARVAGVGLQRLVVVGLALLALLWAIGGLPGRWAVAALWLAVAMVVSLTIAYLRRRDFVRFVPADTLAPNQPARLAPDAKLAVYVTGRLGVDQKTRRFTMLPGFYRTFANGEHALMCLARPRTLFGIPALQAEDRGMWYAFVQPATIHRGVRMGLLYHHRRPVTAVALTYQNQNPSQAGGHSTAQAGTQTIYIAGADAGITARVYADLLWQIPTQPVRASVETI